MTQGSGQITPSDTHVAAPLTRADMERAASTFEQNGFVVFRNVVPQDKLAGLQIKLMEEFESSSQSGRLFSGGGLISGHLNCFPGRESKFAYEALRDHGVLELVERLIPGTVSNMRVGCNFNLPGSVAQHYHADSPFKAGFMVVNVAVVDTDLENGAIDVLPTTHKQFYPFWLYALERAYRLTTRIPMKRGDVLVRTSNLWHRGMPNLTNRVRPMLAFTFGDKGEPLADPFAVDDGKVTFHPNWYRPSRLGRLRERTFVTAPITYSAYRFARSLIGNKGYSA